LSGRDIQSDHKHFLISVKYEVGNVPLSSIGTHSPVLFRWASAALRQLPSSLARGAKGVHRVWEEIYFRLFRADARII